MMISPLLCGSQDLWSTADDAIPNEDVPIYVLTDHLHLLSYVPILDLHHIVVTCKS
jgi:hypothetical protein